MCLIVSDEEGYSVARSKDGELWEQLVQIREQAYKIAEKNNELLDENEQLRQALAELQSLIDTAGAGDIETEQEGAAQETSEASTYEYISVYGNISDSYLNEVLYYYNMIPQNIRDSFIANRWKITVTDKELTIDGISQRILAYTLHSKKEIYIGNVSASSIVHEIGHYIDNVNNYISNSISDDTFNIEVNGLKSIDADTDSHNYSSKIELFAECFSMYIFDNAGLKNNCPDTYEIIEQAISNL
jgi:hypothetical protein